VGATGSQIPLARHGNQLSPETSPLLRQDLFASPPASERTKPRLAPPLLFVWSQREGQAYCRGEAGGSACGRLGAGYGSALSNCISLARSAGERARWRLIAVAHPARGQNRRRTIGHSITSRPAWCSPSALPPALSWLACPSSSAREFRVAPVHFWIIQRASLKSLGITRTASCYAPSNSTQRTSRASTARSPRRTPSWSTHCSQIDRA
jgi:hypothetical protein